MATGSEKTGSGELALPEQPAREAVTARLDELRRGAFAARSVSGGELRALASELLELVEKPAADVAEE